MWVPPLVVVIVS